jgi:hypothetical protein
MRHMMQLTSLDVARKDSNFEALLFRDPDGLVVSLVLCNEVACVHPCSVAQHSRYS